VRSNDRNRYPHSLEYRFLIIFLLAMTHLRRILPLRALNKISHDDAPPENIASESEQNLSWRGPCITGMAARGRGEGGESGKGTVLVLDLTSGVIDVVQQKSLAVDRLLPKHLCRGFILSFAARVGVLPLLRFFWLGIWAHSLI